MHDTSTNTSTSVVGLVQEFTVIMSMSMRRVTLKRCAKLFTVLVILFLILKVGNRVFSSEIDDSQIFNLEFVKDDSNWLENLATSRSHEIPTVVVEEHFEVLQYWFQATELGLIPKSKNVLIHIDGHVDGSIPYNVEEIPWFRPPRDHDEVYIMMQRNDMFIVAAVLTGLIDHVIWVWPSWDESYHDDEDWTHLKYDVEIGIVKKVDGDQTPQNLCYCWANTDSSAKESEDRWKCHIRSSNCIEFDECPLVVRDMCVIQSQAIFEIVGESKASTILSNENWPSEKGLILDLDQDYFGCWSDVIPLYEAGITQENINILSDLVSNVFCSSSAEDEALVDQLYVAIIAFIRSLKFRSCVIQNELEQDIGCLRLVDIENFLIQNDNDIISLIKSKQSTTKFFCNADEEKLEGFFFQSLFQHLLNFSIEQMELLQQLGICLGASPASPSFPSDGNFHVCHGENIPNNTLVPFHLPTEDEIAHRSDRLKEMITAAGKKPNIITICRSVRDGYTPKSFSHLIESKMLDSLSESFRSVNINNVYYDSNLLGGKDGWSGRRQPLVRYLLKYLGYS